MANTLFSNLILADTDGNPQSVKVSAYLEPVINGNGRTEDGWVIEEVYLNNISIPFSDDDEEDLAAQIFELKK